MFTQMDAVCHRFEELSIRLNQPDTAADPALFRRLMREYHDAEPVVQAYRAWQTAQDHLAQAKALLEEPGALDPDFKQMIQQEISEKSQDVEKLENNLKILLLPKDVNDGKNVIVEIRGGAGGEEAALFAHSLLRMYTMYVQSRGWQLEMLNLNETELGGVKEAIFSVDGAGAYNRLKYESGVHRVQRVPETETQGRIHTYQNTLYKLQMTGEQLRRFMEWSAAFFKTWKPDEVTIAFDPSVRYYLYDAFEGVSYELDISKEPGHRIKNLKWPNGKAVKDTDTFVVAVNNYRATTQLLTAADIFLPGEELPKLLEIDVRGDVGGIRELLGEYIRTVKGGTIEPHVNNNWKIVGNNWKAADHQKAVQLLREGKLALNENADARTLPGKAITTADIAKF